ncbi:cassette chromosome recombinase CcrA [Staphylococcus simiae]|uniref:Cassette chromosome recombinase A n=1 Tax=Staphylococcus simiae CCM 7213 = CCUG 51256 TaxID=911238 RepID=G5JK73_9STAP|nr:recombinase family protein [Staphylococcus simiae]EHJ07403.1 cassette chromosome recombinase A [Staphylococcus simiae CCM 7213 = CCUG 51256]PNZ09482.1 recombinase family protein [Staphylococcus simiae]SNV54594.1 cassette chromosome recombinase A [Staphylococcus simiae]
MTQAIGYLRQSTLKQQSLTTQKNMIELLAKKHHIQHITFFSDKQSGRNDDRSGYQQMIELIQKEQCNVLCCYRLNRLHRNLKNALKLVKLCQKHHVHILSVYDGFFNMNQSFDRLKLNVFISLAELESDNIGEQVKNGLREKAKQGKLITTHAPFGYRYHNGTFTINKKEALTVKAVFDYYIQGFGYKKIAQFLEENHYLIDRKPYQVRNIIINPNYCGRVINQYGQFDNIFTAIISTTVYQQAQNIRTNKQLKCEPSNNQLKQKIKCPFCDSVLTNLTIRKRNHSLRYYVCPKNMNQAQHCCPFTTINAKDLEIEVLNICRNFFQNKHVYQMLQDAIRTKLKNNQQKSTKSKMTQAQLIDKLAQGAIDIDTFRKQTSTISQENKKISKINDTQLQEAFKNVITQYFTLNTLYPYIEEIHINQMKQVIGIYFKNEPLNIVNQNK